MTCSALVLAAHGSRAAPNVNARVHTLADRLADLGWFQDVRAAFHQGQPTFSRVLDLLSADEVTVVPFMTSAGYYSNVVLPRELARNDRASLVSIRQTAPVGTHPGIVPLVARRVQRLLRRFGLASSDTCVVVVGHGTPRHPQSRAATVQLAEVLRRHSLCAEVTAAFLDEPPPVDTVVGGSTQPHVLVVPFLIGGGLHETVDIVRTLGLVPAKTRRLPVADWVADRLIVCDSAIGSNPGIVKIIADLVRPTHTTCVCAR